jgi:hypothetical protein
MLNWMQYYHYGDKKFWKVFYHLLSLYCLAVLHQLHYLTTINGFHVYITYNCYCS